MNGRSRAVGLVAATALVGLTHLLSAAPAGATHFRYGHITWAPAASDPSNRTIEFRVENSWRGDAYTTGNMRCIDPTTTPPDDIPCTGAGGVAGVGDVTQERQALDGTKFDPGDGSGLIGSPVPISGSDALLYLVTSVDVADNWMFGVALDPSTYPAPAGCGDGNIPSTCDTTIEHTYASAQTVTAKIEDCCRFSPCDEPNAHINNPDNGYQVETTVDVGTGNSSPVSSLPPIIICPQNGLCTFTVPVSDNDLSSLSFRLATDAEAGFDQEGQSSDPGQGQPGTAAGCAGNASIHPSTGVYSWNTNGCTLAGDPGPDPPNGGCADPSLHTLYSSQVMIEEVGRGTKVALDFLIQLVPVCQGNATPVFDSPPTPACGSVLSINPLSALNFTVQASDADGPSVELNAVSLPSGASMTPAVPSSGNPASSVFSWTPTMAQVGQYVVTFTAKDNCPEQALCTITIDVSLEDCDDGIDNDSDELADCADPDCDGTPCDDSNACTTDDRCDQGAAACVGGLPPNCDDADPCTQDSCSAQSGCVNDEAPATVCTGAPKSLLVVRNKGGIRNRLIWKWVRGDIPLAQLGDPVASTDYTLCVYDETASVASLAIESNVASGGACTVKPCWKQLGGGVPKGFKFKDRNLLQDGTRKLLLKGGKPGHDKIIFKAKGDNIPLPPPVSGDKFFANDSEVTVQLVNDAGSCWQSVYAPQHSVRNRPDLFKAKIKGP